MNLTRVDCNSSGRPAPVLLARVRALDGRLVFSCSAPPNELMDKLIGCSTEFRQDAPTKSRGRFVAQTGQYLGLSAAAAELLSQVQRQSTDEPDLDWYVSSAPSLGEVFGWFGPDFMVNRPSELTAMTGMRVRAHVVIPDEFTAEELALIRAQLRKSFKIVC